MLRALAFAFALALVAPLHAADCPLSMAQAQAGGLRARTTAAPSHRAIPVGTARQSIRFVFAVLPTPRAARVTPASPVPLYLVNQRLLR